ncbi:MAG TPA: glycosyltransferase family 4 protein, partial [Candidatus Solibacter sp.]|nr:glycosyltransferase family 4 protein [Candidatus Solibacter sp.]
MRILLLNDYGVIAGGAEYQFLALRDGLRSRGHDARIFASTARSPELSLADDSFADYHCYGTTSRLQPLMMAANPSAYLRLRKVLAEFSPDIVHCGMMAWQLSPLILPLLRGYRVVHHLQMYNPICPLGSKLLPDGAICHERSGSPCLRQGCLSPQAWAAMMLQRTLWREWESAVDSMIAVSEWAKRRLIVEGARVDDVVYNSVPLRPAAEFSASPSVAFAGRLVPEKGADLLVEAFAGVRACIPEARLTIAGDGPARPALERQMERLGLRGCVAFLGGLPREEMESRIAGAWVQAVPGRWEEPFGLVAAEGMMRGSAVVATALGGPAEIVEQGVTGMLVEPGNPAALAQALTALL